MLPGKCPLALCIIAQVTEYPSFWVLNNIPLYIQAYFKKLLKIMYYEKTSMDFNFLAVRKPYPLKL